VYRLEASEGGRSRGDIPFCVWDIEHYGCWRCWEMLEWRAWRRGGGIKVTGGGTSRLCKAYLELHK
jgi:hypothetical protein